MKKTNVKMTKTMGRGVFAAIDIKKKIVIETAHCVSLDAESNNLIQDSILRFYVFQGKNRSSSVVALGVGSLINHDPKPNVTYVYDAKKNVMRFIAKRKIFQGEQLFIDYGYDPVKESKNWDLKKAIEPWVKKTEEYMDALKEPEYTLPNLPLTNFVEITRATEDGPTITPDSEEKKERRQFNGISHRQGPIGHTHPIWDPEMKSPYHYCPDELKPILGGIFAWKKVKDCKDDSEVVQYTKTTVPFGYSKLIGRLFYRSRNEYV